jgi:restriction system protein
VVEASGWNKEVQHFVDKIVRPNLSQAEAAAIAAKGLSAVAQELIEDRVAARADQIENSLQPTKIDDPVQFERWCANILGKHGWHTTATKSSGDQGADVIAEKAGRRVVLQCKLYSNPVGNKAVQEAFSAERHYRAHASAVVSNAEFTPSARDLARSTGVLLLTPSDLDRLDALVPRDRA